MNSVDIKPLIHEFFPEIQAVVSGVNNLFFKSYEELFEVVNLYNINSLLVCEKTLVFAVHDMFN
jgi:hypothetical protein